MALGRRHTACKPRPTPFARLASRHSLSTKAFNDNGPEIAADGGGLATLSGGLLRIDRSHLSSITSLGLETDPGI